MLSYQADTTATPAQVWRLMARPARWPSWAPHVRGAKGLGDPEVTAGSEGSVRLAGLLPVPARITEVEPGRSWCWSSGPLRICHRVAPREGGGSVITMEIEAPSALEATLSVTYGPAVALLVRNLSRVAERARR
jgi:hypothetical protein